MKIESSKPVVPAEVKHVSTPKHSVANFDELLRALTASASKGQAPNERSPTTGEGLGYLAPPLGDETDSPSFEPCDTPTRLIVEIPITPLPVAMAHASLPATPSGDSSSKTVAADGVCTSSVADSASEVIARDFVHVTLGSGVQTKAQPAMQKGDTQAIEARGEVTKVTVGATNDIILRNPVATAFEPVVWAEAQPAMQKGDTQAIVTQRQAVRAKAQPTPTLQRSSTDTASTAPAQLGDGAGALTRGTVTPPPPVSEASLQALRMEIVSFVQSPSRPQVTLEINPPEYGRVLVRGELSPQGEVTIRLVVENSGVKEQVLMHLQRSPVPAEVEIMTFEEYRDQGEPRGRQSREEARRQPAPRRDEGTTEFTV